MRKIELKWAIIFIVVTLLWMVIEKLSGLHDKYIDKHMYVTNLFAIVAIALFVFALKDKKKNYFKGSMTWKQGFISGLYLTIFITLLTPFSQYITSEYITPDYFTNIINHSVEKGMQTQEEAEAYFNLKSYIIQATVFAFLMGLVTAAVVALFLRNKKKIS